MNNNKFKDIFISDFKMLKNYFTVSFGLLVSRLFGALITILIARSLGDAEFASFSTGFFIMTMLGMSTIGIDKTFVFHFVRTKGREIDFLLSNYTAVKLILLITFVILTILIFSFYSGINNLNITLFLLGSIYSISFWILTYISSIYQALQKFRLYAITQVTYYSLVFGFTLILFLIKTKTSFVYISSYYISAIILMFLLLPFKNVKFSLSKDGLTDLLKKSKWLLFSELLWIVFVRMDYFTVSKFLVPEELGNYALALRMMNMIVIFINSLSLYILPKAADIDSKKKLRDFWKTSYSIVFLLMILNLFLFLFAKPIVVILFGSEYFLSIKFFRMMLIAYLPAIFFPPFKYLILRFNKEINYFIFNAILLGGYFLFLRPSEIIFGSMGPIVSKGIGFLATLFFGVILYITNKHRDLK